MDNADLHLQQCIDTLKGFFFFFKNTFFIANLPSNFVALHSILTNDGIKAYKVFKNFNLFIINIKESFCKRVFVSYSAIILLF